MRKRTKLW